MRAARRGDTKPLSGPDLSAELVSMWQSPRVTTSDVSGATRKPQSGFAAYQHVPRSEVKFEYVAVTVTAADRSQTASG